MDESTADVVAHRQRHTHVADNSCDVHTHVAPLTNRVSSPTYPPTAFTHPASYPLTAATPNRPSPLPLSRTVSFGPTWMVAMATTGPLNLSMKESSINMGRRVEHLSL